MNQLTKLIDELFYKTILQVRTGSTESAKKVFETGIEQILASRPTCGEEQRKFLDEVENFRIEDGLGIFCDSEIVYLSKNFNHLDINRVIKGE